MQQSVLNMESLETEVIKKVNKQFDQLKNIIDEQKNNAQQTIHNLESVKEYKAPPQDLTKETLSSLVSFQQDIEQHIAKQKQMSTTSKFFGVL